MRIISRSALRDFWLAGNAKAETPLRAWYKHAKAANWTSLASIRMAHPATDAVKVSSGKTVYVFNIGGNNYRLIAAIHFNTGLVFTLRVMTHAQYDKEKWKAGL